VSKSDCEQADHAHWEVDSNGLGDCFCDDGFLPISSITPGLPCIDSDAALKLYCNEDANAEWVEDQQDCVCIEGYSPSGDYSDRLHGHPCIPEEEKIMWRCNEDIHATWDQAAKDCFCNDGFEANPQRDDFGLLHPCVPIHEL